MVIVDCLCINAINNYRSEPQGSVAYPGFEEGPGGAERRERSERANFWPRLLITRQFEVQLYSHAWEETCYKAIIIQNRRM